MIKSVGQNPLHELLSSDTNIVYHIPAYQREYSWGRSHWDALFDDLLEEERGSGHFLGTIICVNRTQDAAHESVLELVDGQQRMTTLSLLLLALYKSLNMIVDELDEEQRADLVGLRKMLTLRNPTRARLRPQTQNSNSDDYLTLLREAGLDVGGPSTTYVGVRRLAKALSHFQQRLDNYVESSDEQRTACLLSFYSRVKRSILVKLEVESNADAFMLFESLNNRGLPLTPIDLIKTSILSVADRTDGTSTESAYESWSRWLDVLGDDYTDQERFFRQFYNGFKNEWNLGVKGVSVATRSNLIRTYEEILKSDLPTFLDRMDTATSAYGKIVNSTASDDSSHLSDALRDLARAQAAPSYMLVMYYLVERARWGLTDSDITDLVRFFTKFSIRRNLTNTPPTYDLDRLFIDIIETTPSGDAGAVKAHVFDRLISVSASDDEFTSQLRGPIYEENSAVTRFVLIALARSRMTRETVKDLWERVPQGGGKRVYLWTIEHVLPQGSALPSTWIADLGGVENAREIQERSAHKLGNLTLSGYNSTLSNKSFADKRDRTDNQGRPVGYKNGISLNETLARSDAWTEADIDARTEELVPQILELFTLDSPAAR
ncbi:DUF262 domain-containing protein [Paramicrobacterium agarici]|uniref:DUF262 domain-containing protein n=1 Tax=Paramicrobacterium agarici TaxID=630514 RepID=UPI001474428E|nr:DUF262 domain-containing protein [Microbacterium agarici]